jgi:phosphotriesterase-related protein
MTTSTAITVRGPVPVGQLGRTLMHEHLFDDLTVWFAGSPDSREGAERPVSMGMLGQLRRDAFAVTRDNLRLQDAGTALIEARRFQSAGGGTIVDLSPPGIGRDPGALLRLSEESGLNVVMGCGYYVEAAHPERLRSMTADDIAVELIGEITHGVGDTGIRPGIIGEIGTSGVDSASGAKQGHVTEQEARVLRGSARAALTTGVAVSVHLDARGQGADEVIDILESESLPPHQIVIGHLDHVRDLDYHLRVADRGVFVEYDGFGREYYWAAADVYWGNDAWRIHALAELIDRGYIGQLLVSQDVCFKMDLREYGGYGYDHILIDIVPDLLRSGIRAADLDTILVTNPGRVLGLRHLRPLIPGEATV